MYSAIGSLFNAIRGGQFNIRHGKYVNAVAFGICAAISTGDYLALPSCAVGMFLGSMKGWGDYIGAMAYGKKEDLKEVEWIDFLIKPLLSRPVLWGFAGLTLRGLLWGACLAASFALISQPFLIYLILGVAMGPVYYLVKILDATENRMWPHSEWLYGAVLWSAL